MEENNGIQKFTQALESFLQVKKPQQKSFLGLFDLKKTKQITTEDLANKAQLILQCNNTRLDLSAEIDTLLSRIKHNHSAKYQAIKIAINKKFKSEFKKSNWKDKLYDASYNKILSSKWNELKPDFHIEAPIFNDESRCQIIPSDNNSCSAVMSTTFFSNESYVLNRNTEVTHIMDSCFCAQSQNGDVLFIAMADGLGGHTGSPEEDKRISRASYFGAKHAIRLASTFKDPDTLKKNIHKIVKLTGDQITLKNQGHKDSTTLTCAISFKQDDMMRVIGFNLGDSMLISWHPKTKTCKTLLPGRHINQKIGQGPAYLPANYSLENDLDTIDITLLEDTILIPFTDGLIEAFNANTNEEKINGTKYLMFTIDTDDIIPVLSELPLDATNDDYVKHLMKEVMNRSEAKRSLMHTKAQESEKKLNELRKDDDKMKIASNSKHEKCDEVRRQIDKLSAECSVRDGDDLGIMAVHFGM